MEPISIWEDLGGARWDWNPQLPECHSGSHAAQGDWMLAWTPYI
jgi:hypothetical protein